MRGQRRATSRVPLRAGLELARVAAGVILLFVVARAAYFPVWAAGADTDELARSWGGPNPIGATVAHWLVAALIGAVCVAIVILSTRLLRRATSLTGERT